MECPPEDEEQPFTFYGTRPPVDTPLPPQPTVDTGLVTQKTVLSPKGFAHLRHTPNFIQTTMGDTITVDRIQIVDRLQAPSEDQRGAMALGPFTALITHLLEDPVADLDLGCLGPHNRLEEERCASH